MIEESGDIFGSSDVDNAFSSISLNDNNDNAAAPSDFAAMISPAPAQQQPPSTVARQSPVPSATQQDAAPQKRKVSAIQEEEDLFGNSSSDFSSFVASAPSPFATSLNNNSGFPVSNNNAFPIAAVESNNNSFSKQPPPQAFQPQKSITPPAHATASPKPAPAQIAQEESDLFGGSPNAAPFFAAPQQAFPVAVQPPTQQPAPQQFVPANNFNNPNVNNNNNFNNNNFGVAAQSSPKPQPQFFNPNNQVAPQITQPQQQPQSPAFFNPNSNKPPLTPNNIQPSPQFFNPNAANTFQPSPVPQQHVPNMFNPAAATGAVKNPSPQPPIQQQHQRTASFDIQQELHAGFRNNTPSPQMFNNVNQQKPVVPFMPIQNNTNNAPFQPNHQQQQVPQQQGFFQPAQPQGMPFQSNQQLNNNTGSFMKQPSPNVFQPTQQVPFQPNQNQQQYGAPNQQQQFFNPNNMQNNMMVNNGYNQQQHQQFHPQFQQNNFYQQQHQYNNPYQQQQHQYNMVDMNARQAQIFNFNHQLARPIVSFGFGGKIAVMFPSKPVRLNVLDNSPDDNTPFSQCGAISVYDLGTTLAQTQHVSSLQQYPGPLNANTNKQEIAKFVDQEIYRCQYQIEAFGSLNPRALAAKQLWQLMRLLLLNDSINEQIINNTVLSIKTMLLEHKKDMGSWTNDSMNGASSAIGNIENQQDVIRLEKLLIDGKIEEATQYAIQTKLWAHAILLSVMIDKKTYQKVVTAFAQTSFPEGSPLRTLYMMFADRGDLLFHNATIEMDQYGNTFTSHSRQQQQSQQEQITKLCENWEENLSMIVANRTSASGKVIEKLGDSLWKESNLVESAHFCYLVGDYCCSLDMLQRVALVGGDHKRDKLHYITPSTIQRTEIYEYCKQKVSANNQHYLMPSLLPYKLIYAYWLAEVGMFVKAMQYLEQIAQVFQQTRSVISYSPYFAYHMQVLKHRITESTKMDFSKLSQQQQQLNQQQKSGSGVTGWLYSGLNRIIHGSAAGDDSPQQQQVPAQVQQQPMQQQQQAYQAQQPQQQAARVQTPQQQVQEQPKPQQQEQPKPAQAETNQQVSQDQQKGGWFGWLSFGKTKKAANIGNENKFEWNDKLKRWIPKGANPADFEEEQAPPPPTMMMSSAPSNSNGGPSPAPFDPLLAPRAPANSVASKYVDVGFAGKQPQKTSTTPVAPMNPLMFGVAMPQQGTPSPQGFFTPMMPVNNATEQQDMSQQQPASNGPSMMMQPMQPMQPIQPAQQQAFNPYAQQDQQQGVPMQQVPMMYNQNYGYQQQ